MALLVPSARSAGGFRLCTEDGPRPVAAASAAHVWNASTVAALDSVTTMHDRKGRTVEIHGLSDARSLVHGQLTGQLAAH